MTIAVNGRKSPPARWHRLRDPRARVAGRRRRRGRPCHGAAPPSRCPAIQTTWRFFCGPILLGRSARRPAGLPEEGAYAGDQQKFAKWPAPPGADPGGQCRDGSSRVCNRWRAKALTFKLGAAGPSGRHDAHAVLPASPSTLHESIGRSRRRPAVDPNALMVAAVRWASHFLLGKTQTQPVETPLKPVLLS